MDSGLPSEATDTKGVLTENERNRLSVTALVNYLIYKEEFHAVQLLEKLVAFLSVHLVPQNMYTGISIILTMEPTLFKNSLSSHLSGIFHMCPYEELLAHLEELSLVRETILAVYRQIFPDGETDEDCALDTAHSTKSKISEFEIESHFYNVPYKSVSQCKILPSKKPLTSLDLLKNKVEEMKKSSKPSGQSLLDYAIPSTSRAPPPDLDENILKRCYRQHQSSIHSFSWEEFSSSISSILLSPKLDTEIESELFDTLGEESIELLTDLLKFRPHIKNQLSFLKGTVERKHKSKRFAPSMRSKEAKSKKGKKIKQEEKGESQFQPQKTKTIIKTYKHVHDHQSSILDMAAICHGIANLPFDTITNKNDLYEEVIVPHPDKKLFISDDSIVYVKNLDRFGRIVFKDITSFNTIQSEVFPVAYRTNENMLICAPTGSGKTNVACMAIVHLINNNFENNILMLNKFKIVYICPMKALASEMVHNFSLKLSFSGIKVRELTGDMHLTRNEILETQMIITTPEKWDVITRKGTGDAELTSLVKLLIIDEVHLLNGDRGPVIEAIVARTLRQIISSQEMIRIVGLSATLPSYINVAEFLQVNLNVGLFFFDSYYRSVPLEQTFVGLKGKNLPADLDEVCFIKLLPFLREGHQVMIFVHARNETDRTAKFLRERANKAEASRYFAPQRRQFEKFKFRNICHPKLRELLQFGIGIHHAGMIRSDRNLVEQCFAEKMIRVIVCTATLAWGVNLPAHAVIIKGTEIYHAKRACFSDVDILDVLQIFGRAGRPQFDTIGHGIIITRHEKMTYYFNLLNQRVPIESQFAKSLADHLNAEVVLGTVRNAIEAVEWLTFTYMYKRMVLNPLVYGLTVDDVSRDPQLREHLLKLVHNAAEELDKARLVRYDIQSGDISPTYLGRTASFYYIDLESMKIFTTKLNGTLMIIQIIQIMCDSSEFNNMQSRKEDVEELDYLSHNYCEFGPKDMDDVREKVFILMQTYLARAPLKSPSLISDSMFISQNATRIASALFDIAVHQNKARLTSNCLEVGKAFAQQVWPHQTPLRQFPDISQRVLNICESRDLTIDRMKDMTGQEIGNFLGSPRAGPHIKRCIQAFPLLNIATSLHPITRRVLKIQVYITPAFTWWDRINGGAEHFWIWVEDPVEDIIYYSERFVITKFQCIQTECIELMFTIPIPEEIPNLHILRIISETWLGCEQSERLPLNLIKFPESSTLYTDLLALNPLSITSLRNARYQSIYKMTHFNPIQSQIFHCLYHTDNNVLLGAPTGSGKTLAAEICILRLFNKRTNLKTIYIAPLKALVRERVADWRDKFSRIGKSVVELTGDQTPRVSQLEKADIIITTPEKWDGITRSWRSRRYVRNVGLIIIDEIHLLGEERGPVLEVIVSRMNFIAGAAAKPRIVGLSAAIANSQDVASWLGVGEMGLYNFRSSVRPVPIEVHVKGFPGKFYCPRMLSMNRPTYQAIKRFAPDKPTLVFCSSRKQTRLTALDLMTYLLTDTDPRQWLNCEVEDMDSIQSNINNNDLKQFLSFGIGIHHAGLQESDRNTVEELFLNEKIQVLVTTSTLAWGVNFPARLVVIKGTEYYDGKINRYVDMPISDVLQMIGRAGRPQFDTQGIACVFVEDIKLPFYKQFLYEPFPIESNLLKVLPEHINAEIACETITSKKKLLEYLTWTFLYRRLVANPAFYGVFNQDTNTFLNYMANSAVQFLADAGCVAVARRGKSVVYESTFLGKVACNNYLLCKTIEMFQRELRNNNSIVELINIMCSAEEYATFPVRHNEDLINKKLAEVLSYPTTNYSSPHTKVALLINAYLSNFPQPNQEYAVDLKSVMDQMLRIVQGMVDIISNHSWLSCFIRVMNLLQMLIQGHFIHESTLLSLPYAELLDIPQFRSAVAQAYELERSTITLLDLKNFLTIDYDRMNQLLRDTGLGSKVDKILDYINLLPVIEIKFTLVLQGQRIPFQPNYVISLEPESVYQLDLSFNRTGSTSLNVKSSKYKKQREEGWYLVIGYKNEDKIEVLQKLSSFRQRGNFTTQRIAPKLPGTYTYTIYCLSDSYIGLDQQYKLIIKVTD